jgi:hypothetical protein
VELNKNGDIVLSPTAALRAKGDESVRKLRWLRWGLDSAKSDNLKKVRQRTDQMIKRQEAQQELQGDGQDNKAGELTKGV